MKKEEVEESVLGSLGEADINELKICLDNIKRFEEQIKQLNAKISTLVKKKDVERIGKVPRLGEVTRTQINPFSCHHKPLPSTTQPNNHETERFTSNNSFNTHQCSQKRSKPQTQKKHIRPNTKLRIKNPKNSPTRRPKTKRQNLNSARILIR